MFGGFGFATPYFGGGPAVSTAEEVRMLCAGVDIKPALNATLAIDPNLTATIEIDNC